MKLFEGLSRTDYQDVLRAIGALLDERQLRDIRIWEHERGIIIQGRPVQGAISNTYETILLTDDDLQEILRLAYQRRGQAAA
ncbi:MAG: hypothetical protein C4345_07530, partial [Chloroflexota bacterium]